jgi:hypothetical protein
MSHIGSLCSFQCAQHNVQGWFGKDKSRSCSAITPVFSCIRHCETRNDYGIVIKNTFRSRSGIISRKAVVEGMDESSCGPEALSEEEQQEWFSCCARLMDIGMSSEDASKAMIRGFGWGSQAYWRQELVEAKPSLARVEHVLEYLGSRLGLEKDSDKVEVIKKFPEVLHVEESLMEENVTKLETSFFLKGKALGMSLKRKPRVLGATTDCQGDCAGDCTRCFAQF